MQILASRCEKHAPTPIGIERLRGWTPVQAEAAGGELRIHWADLGTRPFRDPFFFQTVDRYRARESHEILITGSEALEALREASPGLTPNGFIYHVSYCGSTALANVLGAIRHHISLSEPAPLNVAFYGRGATFDERVAWLRGLVSAFGQRRLGTEKSFVVKLSSWALLYFPLLRAAFPQTPWICLYRHPVEVLAGQLMGERVNTYFLDEEFVGLDREARIDMGLAEAAARTLGRYYELIAEMDEMASGGWRINYDQLSEETYSKVLEHFGIEAGAEDRRRMREASRAYSKDPERKGRFEDDSAEKQRDAYPVVHEVACKWALASYSKLETPR